MTAEPGDGRWRRARAVFDEVVDLDPPVRTAAIAERCGGDRELAAEVAALIAADAGEGPLDGPPAPERLGLGDGDGADGLGPGAVVGPFRLDRELGRGGMGVVWRAERVDGHFRQSVALKVVKRGLDTDAVLARFRREREILARLAHPNIARLLDGGATADGRPWLAMELDEGEPLTRWCDDHRLRIEDRLRLALDVCDAVAFAHHNLVVHRDLKPSNIVVTPDGSLRLLDFGIAKLLSQDQAGEADPTALGPAPMTPAYAAPEQLAGAPVTTATDVWGLGLVLYELLVGERPGTTSAVRLPSRAALAAGDETAAHRATTARRLSRQLAGDLDAILLTALAPDPSRRYPDVGALAGDLRRHLAGLPVETRRPTAAYRIGRFVARYRAPVAAVAALVAILAAGLVATAWQARRAAAAAATASAVTDFVTGIFEVSDPSRSRGAEVTARELLDRGARRVATELGDQPGTRGRLELVIGGLYARLGLLAAAEPHLATAEAIAREVDGPDSLAHAEAVAALGHLRLLQGRLPEAEQLQREALEVRRRRAGARSAVVSASLSELAVVRSTAGDAAGAEALHRRALELDRRLHGERSAEVATDLHNIGTALWRQNRLAPAESSVREALGLQRALLGADHPDTLTSLHTLGLVLTDLARYPEAEAALREAIEGRRRVLGASHPDLAFSLDALERVLERTGRYDEAVAAGSEALAIRRRMLPADHPDLANSVNSWAVLCFRLGDLAGAEAGFREALATWRRSLDEDSAEVASAVNNLGVVLLARARLDESSELLSDALARRRRIAGGAAPEVAQTLTSLGRLELERGRLPAAAARLDEALAMSRAVYPDRHPRLAEVLVTAARLHLAGGEAGRALRLTDEALAIRRDVLGSDDPRTAAAEMVAAAAQSAAGHDAEAVRLLSHAAPILAPSPRLELDARRAVEALSAGQGTAAELARQLLR